MCKVFISCPSKSECHSGTGSQTDGRTVGQTEQRCTQILNIWAVSSFHRKMAGQRADGRETERERDGGKERQMGREIRSNERAAGVKRPLHSVNSDIVCMSVALFLRLPVCLSVIRSLSLAYPKLTSFRSPNDPVTMIHPSLWGCTVCVCVWQLAIKFVFMGLHFWESLKTGRRRGSKCQRY